MAAVPEVARHPQMTTVARLVFKRHMRPSQIVFPTIRLLLAEGANVMWEWSRPSHPDRSDSDNFLLAVNTVSRHMMIAGDLVLRRRGVWTAMFRADACQCRDDMQMISRIATASAEGIDAAEVPELRKLRDDLHRAIPELAVA